jgi:hypothetical protein
MAPMVAAAYAAPYAYPHSYAGPACGYYPLSAHVNPNTGRVSQSLPGMMNIVSIFLCHTRLINAGRCFHRQSVVERHRARDASAALTNFIRQPEQIFSTASQSRHAVDRGRYGRISLAGKTRPRPPFPTP